jgi:hypothetical protein
MDVNQDEVRRTMRRYEVDCIIHGHTHRPAVHELQLDGKADGASCSAIGTSKAACCAGTSAARVVEVVRLKPAAGIATAAGAGCAERDYRRPNGLSWDQVTSPAPLRSLPDACNRARQSLSGTVLGQSQVQPMWRASDAARPP